ncbi:MAG: imidazole glycerol phosphate synthase subunit HisH [Hyphomicrobiaceae bacterium]
MQSVAIIDYGSGNLHSAHKAVQRAAHDAGIAVTISVTGDANVVLGADRIILPGVGAFADCKAGLAVVPDMIDALQESVIGKGRPFFGICVGMQLMASRGLEFGETPGLDWIAGEVTAIAPQDRSLKIPHMGWNTVDLVNPHPLLEGLELGETGLHAYFVHSYHVRVADPKVLIAETDYGGALTAVIGRDNLFGTQFHPEKSQALGLRLLANFLTWRV